MIPSTSYCQMTKVIKNQQSVYFEIAMFGHVRYSEQWYLVNVTILSSFVYSGTEVRTMIYSTVKVNPLTKAQKAEHWSFIIVTILSGFVYLVTEVRTMVYSAVKLNPFFFQVINVSGFC